MSEKILSENLSAENAETLEVNAGVAEPVAETPAADVAQAAEATDEPVTETNNEPDVKETVEELQEEPAAEAAEEAVAEEAAVDPAVEEPAAEEAVEPVEAPAETTGEPEAPAEEPAAEEPEVPDEEAATEEAAEEIAAEEAAEEAEEKAVNLAEKTLAELVVIFEELTKKENRMKLNKEVDAIHSAFYKKLKSERETATDSVSDDIFTGLENDFKAFYDQYRRERSEYNAKLERDREENLVKKEAVIADLKALLEKQEDVNATFPAFREIQARWRSIGSVPVRSYKTVNETYQLYVEQFYDMVKINRELRDLDFKKNLEVKIRFCEAAEKLAEDENIVAAFKELQKLHDQWKEYGPVAKQYREQIWDRFKAATAVINKKYQGYFEGLKEHHAENLAAKTALCEKVEEIAEREVKSLGEWNACSKEIEDIQKQWKGIGFATKKENQKIYDRFRAACDKFYGRKRDYYSGFKNEMNDNYRKKVSLCEAAEELKTSTEWKKATDQFLALQKQWKEIGAVPRKKSEQLWKRFRAACDEFFAERDKNAKPENNFYSNLKAKQKLIAEINAYEVTGDDDKDREALEAFNKRWSEIGFVPFKEKESITKAYRDALAAKFPDADVRRPRRTRALSPREKLIQKYNELEQNIVNYENNIGFFAQSKNSAPLILQMQERIRQAKEELKALEDEIRNIEPESEEK
ncbi:MAG: DUF349 domain-containing protein [Bacteroidales bacterium]|nr:DUF349 domain-containing protein [Bacteroidales bacterium]